MYNALSAALLEQIATSVSRIQRHHREVRQALTAQVVHV
jgi:hypothetical protein